MSKVATLWLRYVGRRRWQSTSSQTSVLVVWRLCVCVCVCVYITSESTTLLHHPDVESVSFRPDWFPGAGRLIPEADEIIGGVAYHTTTPSHDL